MCSFASCKRRASSEGTQGCGVAQIEREGGSSKGDGRYRMYGGVCAQRSPESGSEATGMCAGLLVRCKGGWTLLDGSCSCGCSCQERRGRRRAPRAVAVSRTRQGLPRAWERRRGQARVVRSSGL